LPTFKRLATLSEEFTDTERLETPIKSASLTDLYAPTQCRQVVKAHQQLDKTVDSCYCSQPFTSEAKRIEYLFELYDKYTAGLFVQEKVKKKKVKE